jgi:hypothetical protein
MIRMRWVSALAGAGLAELLAQLAGYAWGFGMLLAWVAVMSVQQQAAGTKAASTEMRVAALVPKVGQIQDTANAASSTATSAQTAANNANSNANGRVSKNGDTINGNLTITGNCDVDGTHTVYGACGVHQNLNVLGVIGGNFYMPQSPPGTSLTTLSDCINCCVATIRTLQSAGVFT